MLRVTMRRATDSGSSKTFGASSCPGLPMQSRQRISLANSRDSRRRRGQTSTMGTSLMEIDSQDF